VNARILKFAHISSSLALSLLLLGSAISSQAASEPPGRLQIKPPAAQTRLAWDRVGSPLQIRSWG